MMRHLHVVPVRPIPNASTFIGKLLVGWCVFADWGILMTVVDSERKRDPIDI